MDLDPYLAITMSTLSAKSFSSTMEKLFSQTNMDATIAAPLVLLNILLVALGLLYLLRNLGTFTPSILTVFFLAMLQLWSNPGSIPESQWSLALYLGFTIQVLVISAFSHPRLSLDLLALLSACYITVFHHMTVNSGFMVDVITVSFKFPPLCSHSTHGFPLCPHSQ